MVPEEREFVWRRDPTPKPLEPGDAVEIDPLNGRATALTVGLPPCPKGPRSGLVERVLDAEGRVAVIWDDGERGDVSSLCLRRRTDLQ